MPATTTTNTMPLFALPARDGASKPLRGGCRTGRGDELCDGALQNWASESVQVGKAAAARSYQVLVPWDALMSLAFGGLFSGLLSLALVLALTDRALRLAQDALAFGLLPSVVPIVAAFVWQLPRRVVREADALVLEFVLGTRVLVPLGEVCELVVLPGALDLLRLLRRWSVFPCGLELRCFLGLPTCQASCCVLLSSRCFWSCIFSLETQDLIDFFIDNQRPLDLAARYRTTGKVLVRQGESLLSSEVAKVKSGRWLRVLQQNGRRVRVRFEETDVEGWMSYISQMGFPLLHKEPSSKARSSFGPMHGAIGASEIARGYGAASDAVELAGVLPSRRDCYDAE